MINENYNFVCVNCGKSIKSLYKRYSLSVLKLYNCEYCGNLGDKYLEYDKILILIDLILFSKEAYRHILYNAKYKLMVISYDEYACSQKSVNLQESDKFYEAELYFLILVIILGKLLFFLVLLTFLNFYNIYILKKPYIKNSYIKIWEAVVCSSFGYFLLLAILIWDDFQRGIHVIFITVYITLSQIQALTVTTGVPQPLLGIICTVATAFDHFFTTFMKRKFDI